VTRIGVGGARYVVVGGGVLGVCVTAELAAAGAAVTLLEQADWPGQGATRSSLAWLNSNAKTPAQASRRDAAPRPAPAIRADSHGRRPGRGRRFRPARRHAAACSRSSVLRWAAIAWIIDGFMVPSFVAGLAAS